MRDVPHGRVACAVLSFGGFLGLGDKLLAIPWSAFTLDADNERFILNVPEERLDAAPGFDNDAWPAMADFNWADGLHGNYDVARYWQ